MHKTAGTGLLSLRLMVWPIAYAPFGYLPGATLKDAPDDPRLMRNVGEILARLGQALRGFFHPGADHLLAWDLKRMDRLSDLAANINDPTELDLVEHVLDRFRRLVKPPLARSSCAGDPQ